MKGIFISEPNVFFVNLKTGEKHLQLWDFLKVKGWEKLNPENFEYNNLQGVLKRDEWKPVLGDIIPIYPGMKWNNKTRSITDPFYIPQKKKSGLDEFLVSAENFFKRFNGKKIGVQLSGGLDSTIIIGLLKHLDIPFHLIGMSTTRYEFRTERYMQQKLQEWTDYSALIDYEQYLPMSHLDKLPPFQHPDLLAINYGSESAMAKECKKQGVQVLLTGDGGDNLFAEPIPLNHNECTWLPQVFSDCWLTDIVYAPYGVDLIPFYADPGVMDVIYNLRLGHEEDNEKIWARKFFKDFLPSELVDYTYCADFWGLYIDGLQQAIPEIEKLFHTAHELTGHEAFSKTATKDLLGQDLLYAKKQLYQIIEARTAIVVWLNVLERNNLIGL
jgi:hypothetical protein